MRKVFEIGEKELSPLLSKISVECRDRAERIAVADTQRLIGDRHELDLGHLQEIMKLSLLLALCEVAPDRAFREECRSVLSAYDPRFIPGEEIAWSNLEIFASERELSILPPGAGPSWIWLKQAYLRRVGFCDHARLGTSRGSTR